MKGKVFLRLELSGRVTHNHRQKLDMIRDHRKSPTRNESYVEGSEALRLLAMCVCVRVFVLCVLQL